MEHYKITIIVSIVFAVIELATLTLVFFGLAIGGLVVATVQYLSNGYDINRDVIIFAVTSLIVIILLRKIFREKVEKEQISKDDVNDY